MRGPGGRFLSKEEREKYGDGGTSIIASPPMMTRDVDTRTLFPPLHLRHAERGEFLAERSTLRLLAIVAGQLPELMMALSAHLLATTGEPGQPVHQACPLLCIILHHHRQWEEAGSLAFCTYLREALWLSQSPFLLNVTPPI